MITAVILAIALASFGAALLAISALILASRQPELWEKCPECNWYHCGCEFKLQPPTGSHITRLRICTCCETLQHIEHQKKVARQVR
jgi:hypothetical protein